jgi:CHAT domain-containing protein
VADPALSAPVRRRFAIATRLDQAVAEARLAATLWPDARLLTGAEAEKSAVLEAWRQAPCILIAAHLVRAPDPPFLGFIPLAANRHGTVERLEEPYTGSPADLDDSLDPGDVRALDLSGCDLVVLSACASGAPDLSAKRVAPSFGDAFLDAGARATLQTLWPVADDQARAFVTGFLRASAGGLDPVRALGETRRAALADAEGRRHPSVWAAWSVGIVGFPPPRPAKPRA